MRSPASRATDGGTAQPLVLALALCVLTLGGVVVDLFHLAAEYRSLAGVADAAAVAAAGMVDVDHYRATGEVLLDPTEARAEAHRLVEQQAASHRRELTLASVEPVVGPIQGPGGVTHGGTVTVTLEATVATLLTHLLPTVDSPVRVRAQAVATTESSS